MNTQKDSIPVQLFIKLCIFICFTLSHYHSNLVHTFLSLFNITDLKIILYLIMVTFVAETLCFNLATFYYEIFFLIFIIRGLRFASCIIMFPFQDHSKNYCGLSKNFQD